MEFRSIKTKLAIATGICFFVIVSSLITYSTISIRNLVIEDAKEQAMQSARNFSSQIEAEMEVALDTARTLAYTLSAVKDPSAPLEIGRDQVNSILSTLLRENASFFATYTLWEPNAFDEMDLAYANKPGHDRSGRFVPYWSRGPNGLIQVPRVSHENAGMGDYYQAPKQSKWEATIEPYVYPVQGEEVMITSLVVPIMRDGQFYGVVGVDIRLDTIQAIVDAAHLYGDCAQVSVVSHKGKIVAASGQAELQGKPLASLHADWQEDLNYVRNGDSVFEEDEGRYAVFTPISMGRTGTPWSLNVNIPPEVLTADATRQMRFSILIGISICVFSLAVICRLIARIVAPLDSLTEMAERVALGDLDCEDIHTSDDEIGRVNAAFVDVVQSLRETSSICEAVALGDFSQSARVRGDKDVLCQSINRMGQTLGAIVRQANAIAQGDYSSEIQPHSEADELGCALANMTHQLRDTTAENQRENWFKSGQSELNDKMRGEHATVDLARNIITQLAAYVDAQIGAIFLAEDDQTLRLVSSFAYTRRKGIGNEFPPGQGLVGQALMEEKTIIVTDLPDDYIVVQSGVGQAVPKNILVLPFQHDGKVIGVLELGSFHEFTDKQVAFLEEVSENIAIAVNAAQSRHRMSELLKETQRQSEALEQQQEELRATNEELEEQAQQLKASQEQLESQQEELEMSNAELEESAAILEEQKRALEVSRNEIQAKSKELEMSNKYKSEFLSNMSHELRTPLNSLLILTKLLTENSEGNLTDDQIESCNMIYEGGQELLSLINEILDLAKIEAGKMEFSFKDVSMSQLAQSLENEFTHVAGNKDLEFKVDMAEGLPEGMKTDAKRAKQILKNLLSNAFKFTAKGGITVRISRPGEDVDLSSSHLDHASAIAFAVSDTGIGIPEAKQHLIFKAFQQADGNIDREYGGTGLGLSISTHLAKHLGGEIQLQSQADQGSTFTLYLPETMEATAMEDQAVAAPHATPEPAPVPPSPQVAPENEAPPGSYPF